MRAIVCCSEDRRSRFSVVSSWSNPRNGGGVTLQTLTVRRPNGRLLHFATAAIAFILTSSIATPEAARQNRFRLSPARAEAFAEAARRGINYLPGEVIIKFKPGSTRPVRERALSRLRSRPSDTDLRWIGN